MQDSDAVNGVYARSKYNMVNLHVCMSSVTHYVHARSADLEHLAKYIHVAASVVADTYTHRTITVSSVHALRVNNMLYSWKYWWELNLAVEPKIAIARILADLNLAVRYGIVI